jgi:putative nucleotidyltransferase with HDIG domain
VKIDTRLFRSILARRFFTLFVVSAVVPTAILAVVAYPYVSDQLFEQSADRMWRAAKAESMSVYERLLFLESQLRAVAPSLTVAERARWLEGASGLRVSEMFDCLSLSSAQTGLVTVFGDPPPQPQFDADQTAHLERGGTLLITAVPGDPLDRDLWMWMLSDRSDPSAGMVVGTIARSYLWGLDAGSAVPADTEICVYDEYRRFLSGSFVGCAEITPDVEAAAVESVRGDFSFEFDDRKYRASYRNLFLQPVFMVKDWTFVLIESEDRILGPMRDFRNVFPPVVLTSLWVVLLLSIYSIRRSLVPLDRLTEGTKRIAAKDFSTRVTVDSGDEFEDLAGAFNTMSDRLRRQFTALATNAGIHRAILSSLETSTIIETAVIGGLEAVDADVVGVALRNHDRSDELTMLFAAKGAPDTVHAATATLTDSDANTLAQNPESVLLNEDGGHSGLLEALPMVDDLAVTAFPVLLEGRLHAVLCVGRAGERQISDEERAQARQLADQVAVALSNSRLIEELKALTWGTLEAFARAIDAKSPWTAGHSERVTEMSLRIARKMGRSQSELEVLHRGALLHDIGKLGISMQVLDKPGRLEEDEIQHVMTHPTIGGRILEPISAFADILPIVTQHHEKYDGTGYPDQLVAEQIDINARILAVADTYDAMTSDRPYRKGFEHAKAVGLILEESGKQFDPDVLRAFMVAVSEDPRRVTGWVEASILKDVAGG